MDRAALHVDRVRDELAGQREPHRPGHLGARLLLRLGRAGAQVRGAHHGRELEQRVAGGRLGGEHVDARPGHPAFLQREGQRVLIDDAAAGRVHDPHGGLDQAQLPVPEQAGRLRVLGQVHGDEVGLGQQLVQAGQPHAGLRGPGRGHVRVVGDHPHAERGQPLRHQQADPAEPEDAGHLAVQLHAGEGGPPPLAAAQRRRGLGHVPGHRQQQADRVLGRAHDVRGGRVHHHDPGPGRRLDVHVVQADAGPGDHPEPGRVGQRLGIDPGRAAHDDRVGGGQRGEQRAAIRAVHVPDVEVGFELGDGGRRQFLSDEYDRCRHGGGPSCRSAEPSV